MPIRQSKICNKKLPLSCRHRLSWIQNEKSFFFFVNQLLKDMLPTVLAGGINPTYNNNWLSLEDYLFVSPAVLQASLLALILVQIEMQIMFQMTVIQYQLNRKKNTKILKKMSMM